MRHFKLICVLHSGFHLCQSCNMQVFFFIAWSVSKGKENPVRQSFCHKHNKYHHTKDRMVHITQHSKIQHKAMRCDAMRYDSIRYDTMRYDTKQYDPIQYKTMRYDAKHYHIMRYDKMQRDNIRYNEIRCDTIESIQHNTTLLLLTTHQREGHGQLSCHC